ncbi:hypothetical protein FisN_4Lh210 [Fistulifera solaris]|uniref:Uncharacterized protein n=1 Tax=Fistulifera solaris TaxID=1519565 RepID=A0A1Z5JYV4_FISSO|nr:hypothetical protein FisN_4Lh210 [Fistulifera solaris]|eukprot:GAX19205.1 hypothetical protein FisN_4Lh210 [Fistulifera solaris]
MSLSISSYESDVSHDEGNLFDMTIDATSTACLNIVDLMMKGFSCDPNKSKAMMKSWIKAFDCLVVDNVDLQRAQSRKRLHTMKRNITYNPSREKQSRAKKNVFESPHNHNVSYDYSVSYDDTLADQSAELDQSTLSFSALMESDFSDHSGFLERSTYDSEESSSDEGSSGSQSHESDEDGESLDKVDVRPIVKKIRRRTVISITRAGQCVDQIDMGTLPKSSENRSRRWVETMNHRTQSRSSPSSTIIRDDKGLSPSVVFGFISKSEKSMLPERSKGAKLASLSRNLFGEESIKRPSNLVSAKACVLDLTHLTPAGSDLLRWIMGSGLFIEFPSHLVSHRHNILSIYSPICSLLPILIAAMVRYTQVSKNDALSPMDGWQGNDEQPAVTIIYSKDAAFELSIDEDRGTDGASTTLARDIYAYLHTYPDDESNDSDATQKFCHRKRVSWSPQLSSHFYA